MEKGTKLILSIGDDTFIYVSPNKYIDSDTLVNTFIGLMQAHTYYIDTIITTEIEHPSVYNTCKYLETLGYRVYYAPIDCLGRVDTYELEKIIKENDIKLPLVSIMFANNFALV